jgi:hypothetical protein
VSPTRFVVGQAEGHLGAREHMSMSSSRGYPSISRVGSSPSLLLLVLDVLLFACLCFAMFMALAFNTEYNNPVCN